MDFYPIFLDIKGKTCLVVGGGRVAERKIEGLMAAGARVEVCAKSLTERLSGLMESRELAYLGDEYDSGFLDGAFLVMVATDDEPLNRRVAEDARSRGVPVNVADVPELCSFILPALVRRGPLTVAVSTGGASPAAARHIREGLESLFGPEYSRFLRLMGLIREKRLGEPGGPGENRELFTRLARAGIPELMREERMREVEELVTRVMGEGYTFEELGFRAEDGEEGEP